MRHPQTPHRTAPGRHVALALAMSSALAFGSSPARASSPEFTPAEGDEYTEFQGDWSALPDAAEVLPTTIVVEATMESSLHRAWSPEHPEQADVFAETCTLDRVALECPTLGTTAVQQHGRHIAVQMTDMGADIGSLTTDSEVGPLEAKTTWHGFSCVIEPSDHDRCNAFCAEWGHGGGVCIGGEPFFLCDAIYCKCDDGYEPKSIPEVEPAGGDSNPHDDT